MHYQNQKSILQHFSTEGRWRLQEIRNIQGDRQKQGIQKGREGNQGYLQGIHRQKIQDIHRKDKQKWRCKNLKQSLEPWGPQGDRKGKSHQKLQGRKQKGINQNRQIQDENFKRIQQESKLQ